MSSTAIRRKTSLRISQIRHQLNPSILIYHNKLQSRAEIQTTTTPTQTRKYDHRSRRRDAGSQQVCDEFVGI